MSVHIESRLADFETLATAPNGDRVIRIRGCYAVLSPMGDGLVKMQKIEAVPARQMADRWNKNAGGAHD